MMLRKLIFLAATVSTGPMHGMLSLCQSVTISAMPRFLAYSSAQKELIDHLLGEVHILNKEKESLASTCASLLLQSVYDKYSIAKLTSTTHESLGLSPIAENSSSAHPEIHSADNPTDTTESVAHDYRFYCTAGLLALTWAGVIAKHVKDSRHDSQQECKQTAISADKLVTAKSWKIPLALLTAILVVVALTSLVDWDELLLGATTLL